MAQTEMTNTESTDTESTDTESTSATTPEAAPGAYRPSFAVWKFASCDGCQLSLLNCEDELLAVAGAIRISHFPEATRARAEGPFDVSLVEGSISTPEGVDRIHRVRAMSRRVVAIGACATSGGIQALRNFTSLDRVSRLVYAHPEYVATLERSTPVSAHITVDFELRGCPIDQGQLVEVIAALLQGRRPRVPRYSVCAECKRQGITCLMVAHGTPCLGPVTQAGCGAVCPRTGRGCYACFGPQDAVNTAPLAERLVGLGMSRTDVARTFRTYNAGAEPFRRESLRQEEVADR
jgi:sulfhydrogenase subunit delta